MSEGAFGLSSLFGTAGPEPATDEEKAGKRDSLWTSVGADPWGGGRDLPSLLQQVSLKGRRDSGGVFADDMASLPRKRVSLFSSLRLRKREESDSEGQDQEVQKEIRTILANLKNKGWCSDSQPFSAQDPLNLHRMFFLANWGQCNKL